MLNFNLHINVPSYVTVDESRNFIGRDYCRSGSLRFVYLGFSIMCRIRGAASRSGVLDFNFLELMADIGHILCSNFAVYEHISTCDTPIDKAGLMSCFSFT